MTLTSETSLTPFTGERDRRAKGEKLLGDLWLGDRFVFKTQDNETLLGTIEAIGGALIQVRFPENTKFEPRKLPASTWVLPVSKITIPQVLKEGPETLGPLEEDYIGTMQISFFDQEQALKAQNELLDADWRLQEGTNSSSHVRQRRNIWFLTMESRDFKEEKPFFEWLNEVEAFVTEHGGVLSMYSLVMTKNMTFDIQPAAEINVAEA